MKVGVTGRPQGATFAVRRSEAQAQRRAQEARPEPEWRPPGPGP